MPRLMIMLGGELDLMKTRTVAREDDYEPESERCKDRKNPWI
jgi:hypothetical protein